MRQISPWFAMAITGMPHSGQGFLSEGGSGPRDRLAAHQAAKSIPQSATEAVLEAWATDLGVDIRRNHELLAIAEKDDAVEITVRGPEGEHRLRAEWLDAFISHRTNGHSCG